MFSENFNYPYELRIDRSFIHGLEGASGALRNLHEILPNFKVVLLAVALSGLRF